MRKIITGILLAIPVLAISQTASVTCDTEGIPNIFRANSYRIVCDGGLDAADITGWMVCLPVADSGDMQIIASGAENRSFTVDALTLDNLTDNYVTDSKGICQARFYIFAETSGVKSTFEQDMPVSLAPWLGTPEIISFNPTEREYIYTADYTVEFAGVENNRLTVAIEEEYSSILNSEYLYPASSPLTGTSKRFNNLYYAWLLVDASNRFGHTETECEIKPGAAAIALPSANSSAPDWFAVYSVTGILLAKTTDITDLSLLPPGLYIIRTYAGDRLLGTIKKTVR